MTDYFKFLGPWKKRLCGLKNNNRVFPTPEDARIEEDINLVDKVSFLNSFIHLKVLGCTSGCNHVVCIESNCHPITKLGTYFKTSRLTRNILNLNFIDVFLICGCNKFL